MNLYNAYQAHEFVAKTHYCLPMSETLYRLDHVREEDVDNMLINSDYLRAVISQRPKNVEDAYYIILDVSAETQGCKVLNEICDKQNEYYAKNTKKTGKCSDGQVHGTLHSMLEIAMQRGMEQMINEYHHDEASIYEDIVLNY